MSASEKAKEWEVSIQLLQSMTHRVLAPSFISCSVASLGCEACVRWSEALSILHHMQGLRHVLRTVCCKYQRPINATRASQEMPSRYPQTSCCYAQDASPYAVLECFFLTVVHKPPGWEIGQHTTALGNYLSTWLREAFPNNPNTMLYPE